MKKVALVILDGWGHGKKPEADAIQQADTPFVDSLYNGLNAELLTDGRHVGLPDGQMGNSEVGHLNIGAGRVVHQDLVKINLAIEDDTLRSNEILTEAFSEAQRRGGRIHFMGLVSDGGVHSHQNHLHALVSYARDFGLKDVFVHAFLDGRDCNPTTGLGHISKLQKALEASGGQLASLVGRYYAMDRDKRWGRIKEAYDLLVHGKGVPTDDPLAAIQASYDSGVTDEFMKPIVCVNEEKPVGTIQPNDVVVCFNFRTDRCREITMALTQADFPEEGMSVLPLHYVTMTEYDATFKGVHVVFRKDNLRQTLGEVVEQAGLQQIRIAETEKYPHVTFFFSGGREVPFEGERRLMIKSPKVATYDLKPEMSAAEVTETILKEIEAQSADFICLNFANPDMVGHTGVFEAVVKAVETVDACLSKIVEAGGKNDYSFVVIADHGNADKVVNEDGSPNTAHTTNPVPVFILDDRFTSVKDGILADVAPTILELMGISQPSEMTGKSLLG